MGNGAGSSETATGEAAVQPASPRVSPSLPYRQDARPDSDTGTGPCSLCLSHFCPGPFQLDFRGQGMRPPMKSDRWSQGFDKGRIFYSFPALVF